MDGMEAVRNRLKELIEANGIDYLEREPYEVYQDLLENKLDSICARLVLSALTALAVQRAQMLSIDVLSRYFSVECCLKKKAADQLAAMFKELLNQNNTTAWEERRDFGFREFCEASWEFHYSGEGQWRCSNGYYDCYCEIKAEIQVSDPDLAHKTVAGLLQNNPFTTAEDIFDFFDSKLSAQMDDDLEYYVTAEKYYPPVMEDFEGEDYLKEHCEELGLEVLSCECDGNMSDFEPDDWRW